MGTALATVTPLQQEDTRAGEDAAPGATMAVEVNGLGKSFGAFRAVRGVNFGVEQGSTVTLLGPSGCGKTTTLRMIAGLEVPSEGAIKIGGQDVYDAATDQFVAPERRNIGMVFQSYAIWPHMTVGGNVAFPLRIRRMRRSEIRERVRNVLALVGLEELQDRSASALSGGQQQRVALARALVAEPATVLFDEPLSNLDANLRERMRVELQLLQSQLKFTSIFVTHDQQEAMALSDRVILMNRGTVEQAGSPQHVFQTPHTAFAARFLGYSNCLTGEVRAIRPGSAVEVDVEVAPGVILAGRWRSDKEPVRGDMAEIAFRADRMVLTPAELGGEGASTAEAVVSTAAFMGNSFDYLITMDGLELKAEGSLDTVMARGDTVRFSVAPQHCHVFRAESD